MEQNDKAAAELGKLVAMAEAATPGPWMRSERPNGPFWHISSGHTIGGKPCANGRQAIGSVHAANKRNDPKYAAMFEANASFIAAANPDVILRIAALVAQQAARIEEMQQDLNDARNGWESAASTNVAQKIHALTEQAAPEATSECPIPHQHWPFVESPGQFTARLESAMQHSVNLLAAVRTVLIEHPPTLSTEATSECQWPNCMSEKKQQDLADEVAVSLFGEQATSGDTGDAEADRVIDRLMSSDPQFDDCTDAAALIRRLVIERKPLTDGTIGEMWWRTQRDKVEYPHISLAREVEQHHGIGSDK